jgi:bifunctional non-homologous end joining protein LigD
VWTRDGEVGTATASDARFRAATQEELAALDGLPDRGTWTVGGREVTLTNLDKVLFPSRDGDGFVTKRELVRYHAAMAPWMLPYLADRPLDAVGIPTDVDRKGIWQKHAPRHAPDWIERWTNPDAGVGESTGHLVIGDLPALVWLANQAAVELHPWPSRRPDVEHPTYVFLDLDPGDATTWPELLTVARLQRTALEHLGLRGYPKTTGRRGIQVWIPIEPGPTFDETRAWVHQLSDVVAAVAGDLVSTKWEKRDRKGRARLGDTQNASNQTPVAPYSARAAAGGPVSMPITWDELDDATLRPDGWDVRSAPARVADDGDPMARMLSDRQHLVPLR